MGGRVDFAGCRRFTDAILMIPLKSKKCLAPDFLPTPGFAVLAMVLPPQHQLIWISERTHLWH